MYMRVCIMHSTMMMNGMSLDSGKQIAFFDEAGFSSTEVLTWAQLCNQP